MKKPALFFAKCLNGFDKLVDALSVPITILFLLWCFGSWLYEKVSLAIVRIKENPNQAVACLIGALIVGFLAGGYEWANQKSKKILKDNDNQTKV